MPYAGIEGSSNGTAAIFVSQNGEVIYLLRKDWEILSLETPRWLSTNLWNSTSAVVGGIAFDDTEDKIASVCTFYSFFFTFLILDLVFGDDGSDETTNFATYDYSDSVDKIMPLILNVREIIPPSSKRSAEYIYTGEMKKNVEGPSCVVGDLQVIGPDSGSKMYIQCHNGNVGDTDEGNSADTANCGNYSVDLEYW